MKIVLLSDDAIRVEPVAGPLTIEAIAAEQSYSPFHMLASGLAMCTFSVMSAWASHAELSADDLAIEVRWTFSEDPHRVDQMKVSLDWPSLPAKRQTAAQRVAEMCTIHATLTHPPAITITLGESQEPIASSTTAQGHEETATEPLHSESAL